MCQNMYDKSVENCFSTIFSSKRDKSMENCFSTIFSSKRDIFPIKVAKTHGTGL